jgi:porin
MPSVDYITEYPLSCGGMRVFPNSRLPIPASFAVLFFASVALFGVAHAQEAQIDIARRGSLGDAPGGVKDIARSYGLDAQIWSTQIFQGITSGDKGGVSRYGGKVDSFFRLDPEKIGLLPGFHLDVQYEHYFGLDVNRLDDALVPVNTAQAYLRAGGYHSALSITGTQRINEDLSVSIGKFNLMTIASRTPLIGGGGLNTFMNRAFALPTTGVSYTSGTGGAGDRVVLSPPYSLGGTVEYNKGPVLVDLFLTDPRSAQDPRVIQRPFEEGVAIGGGIGVKTSLNALNGTHLFRVAYSNAKGVNLETISDFTGRLNSINSVGTKKGYWFSSYYFTQNLFQDVSNPEQGWGIFGLYTLSDGNPTPIKWSMLAGFAGNNLLEGRKDDRWGVGFYHFGVSQQLLTSLQELNDPRNSEGGIEAFYNLALNKWSYLSADLQIIDPWNPNKPVESLFSLRMQNRF